MCIGCRLGDFSKDQHEQQDHHDQADEKNDSDGTAEKFQHAASPLQALAPRKSCKKCTNMAGRALSRRRTITAK